MCAQPHLLPAGEDDRPPDLLVTDLRRAVPADQNRPRSPRSRETRDRLTLRIRERQVSLGPAHPVHETEACRGTRVRGPVNAEVSPILHDAAFNGVLILLVRPETGAVGRVEWLDSYEWAARGSVRFGVGHWVVRGMDWGTEPRRTSSQVPRKLAC